MFEGEAFGDGGRWWDALDEVLWGERVGNDVQWGRRRGQGGEGGVGVQGVADLIHSSVFWVLKLALVVESVLNTVSMHLNLKPQASVVLTFLEEEPHLIAAL